MRTRERCSIPLARFIFFLSLLCVSTVISLKAASAQTLVRPSWCQPKNQAKVSIKTDTDRITWVYNKSEKDLNSFNIDTKNPYGKEVITDVGGLMQGGIQMAETMRFSTLTHSGLNQVCMFYDAVEVSFHIFPTIYIASEFPQGSCMHNAIKQHELKHINTDRQIVNRYAQAVGQSIKAEIQRQNVYGPIDISQIKAMQALMKSKMENILLSYSAKMDAERRLLQQQIDSLAEYQRVNKSCIGKR